ncbi:hypothetical protein IFM89_003344 [Coptis chinensis]|uniref:GTP-binding protein n=1 Tax=Coptis chinensis TaxID=261450 RepID=A0A835ITV9_9MAGN|nr:hypothetical protein IFM89_003344 [Coptis chinensis]
MLDEVEEGLSLRILLKKQNKALIVENKAIREDKERREIEELYEKDGDESSLGTPVAKKSHLEEVRKSHLEEEFSAALARIRAAARSYNKIKLLLIGNYGVGKPLLHRRFISADSKSDSSLAQNIFHTTMKIQLDEKPIELEVWSMPVEEEYRSLYVYTKVLVKSKTYARDNVYKILVGNKADKGESERVVSTQALANEAMAAARAKQFEVQLFLLGDRGVGKRSLRVRDSSSNYRSPRWSGDYFSIFEKIQIDEKLIELKIYHMKEDQGTESYNYPGTKGIILVYDLTNESTFNNIRDWIGDVKQYALHNVGMILVGNKFDLHTTKRAVPTSMGQALANEYGMKFFETSAKSYYNVEEAFLSITRDVIEIMEFTHLLRKSAFGNKK